MKLILFYVGFIFIVFFLTGFYVFYIYKYPKAKNTEYIKQYYSQDIIKKLGAKLEDPTNRFQYFLHFPPKKNKNTIRIGAFGNSYTYGSDVDRSKTYPYQLYKIFEGSFFNKKIEVLNFGVRGHSFQEQFFLWEKYAKKYEIDYILLGPKEFFPDRDLTFSQNWDFELFNYPRERFILSDKNKVKTVSIKQPTLKKRYKKYYTLIPPYISLRYDRRPFQIYELFFPFFRNSIKNPFYYNEMSMEEESAKINIILLEKMRKIYNKKIFILIDDFPFIDELEMNRKFYKPIENLYNFNYLNFSLEDKVLYRSFYHYSSLGYELISNYFFHALIGKKKFIFHIFNCFFEEEVSIKKKYKINLHNITSIRVFFNKKSLLKMNMGIDHGMTKFKINKKVKSFIGFSSKKTNDFGNLIYHSVPIDLKANMKVYVETSNKMKVEVGKVVPIDHYHKIFTLYSKNIENLFDRTVEAFSSFFKINKHVFSLKQERITLLVDNHSIGHLVYNGANNNWKIIINNSIQKLVFTGPSSLLEKELPRSFPLFVEYTTHDREKLRSHFFNWKCKKTERRDSINLPNFTPLK